jgi:tetratricopeptide (TPR) repeat protein
LPLEELESLRVVTMVSDEMKYLTLLAEGMIRYERDDYRGTIDILTSALEQGKVPPEIVSPADLYFCRGCAYSLAGDCKMGLADFNKAISVDKEYALAYRDRSALYFLRGELEEARRDADEAVRLRPSDGSCRESKAFAELWSGDVGSALVDSIQAARLDPKEAQNRNTIGLCRLMIRDPGGAIAEFTSAIALDKTEPALLANRGLAYLEEGELELAAADFETAVRLDPKWTGSYDGLVTICWTRGEYEQAIRYCDLEVSMGRADAMTYYNRALLNVRHGDDCEAINDYGKLIALLTNSTEFGSCAQLKRGGFYLPAPLRRSGQSGDFSVGGTRERLAEAYCDRGLLRGRNLDHDGLFEDLSAALKMWDCIEDAGDMYRLRAKIYMERGELDAAMNDCSTALEFNPEDGEAYVLRAQLHGLRGEPTNAVADCNTALAYAPDDASAYAVRGAARIQEGDYTRALRDSNQALKLNANLKDAYKVRGHASICLGLYESGIEDQTRVLRVNPSAGEYCIRAWAYLKTGRYDEAISDAKRALSLDPNSAAAYYDMAGACAAKEDTECATSALRTAHRLDPTLGDEGDLDEFKFIIIPSRGEWKELGEHP